MLNSWSHNEETLGLSFQNQAFRLRILDPFQRTPSFEESKEIKAWSPRLWPLPGMLK